MNLFLFADRQFQVNGPEPWFAEKAANMTVAEGRTATLPCVVENLGKHKVRKEPSIQKEFVLYFINLLFLDYYNS